MTERQEWLKFKFDTPEKIKVEIKKKEEDLKILKSLLNSDVNLTEPNGKQHTLVFIENDDDIKNDWKRIKLWITDKYPNLKIFKITNNSPYTLKNILGKNYNGELEGSSILSLFHKNKPRGVLDKNMMHVFNFCPYLSKFTDKYKNNFDGVTTWLISILESAEFFDFQSKVNEIYKVLRHKSEDSALIVLEKYVGSRNIKEIINTPANCSHGTTYLIDTAIYDIKVKFFSRLIELGADVSKITLLQCKNQQEIKNWFGDDCFHKDNIETQKKFIQMATVLVKSGVKLSSYPFYKSLNDLCVKHKLDHLYTGLSVLESF